MAEVELNQVSRQFADGTLAVDGVSFTVQDREFLVLVGPSGCGKSTTLRMIAGLEPLSGGQIRIAGALVNDVPPRQRDIAMVFQNYALYPHMSVRANMAFALELRYGGSWLTRLTRRIMQPGRAAELAERRRSIGPLVQETARTLSIEHLLDRLPRQLSGGERQRVALGRAIVRQPAAFLFDEPLSNLDARLRVEMRKELKELHRRLGATMIYVTHDQVEALTLGDRIAVMNQGVLQQIGTPREVYDRPRNTFVAGFLGTPSMNLFGGRLQSRVGRKEFVAPGICQPLPEEWQVNLDGRPEGEEMVLGVRPENVYLLEDGNSPEKAATQPGLKGTVRVVEPLGEATLAYVSLAGAEVPADGPTLIARLPARTELAVGERITLGLDAERLHLFDRNGLRWCQESLSAAGKLAESSAETTC